MTTSTSTEPTVLKASGRHFEPGALPDLRAGVWTRVAGSTALGDPATEAALQDVAEEVRSVARAQGYAAGWASGCRSAQAKAEARLADVERQRAAEQAEWTARQRRLLDALVAATETLGADVGARYAELTDLAVDLALEIAEAVVGREVATMPDAGAVALRRALRDLPPAATVTVRLNPGDALALEGELPAGANVTLVADPAVAHGDAVAETSTGSVDAGLATAMARVREVLGR